MALVKEDLVMLTRMLGVLAVLTLVATPGRTDNKQTLARKDLAELQGTWQLETIDDGKDSKLGAKKRTLFIGGELFLVRDGDKMVQVGTVRLVPTRTPKHIDATVKKGQHEDNTMLGIYELKGDTLKVCFDPEGESRPRTFATKSEGARFTAVYKRARASGDQVDIGGRYKCESGPADGKKQVMDAEIRKHGDAYVVRWSLGGDTAYVGTGIRQGSTLSVAWANRGTLGISVYRIEKGPKLVGVCTEVGGAGLVINEVLTSSKTSKESEVRLRQPNTPARR
jgi:uncharacterized protein (TIGR03067 family)